MRFTPVILSLLSLSLFTLTGCEGLLTAPAPGGETTGSKDQSTSDITDPAKPTTTFMYVMNGVGKTIDEINLKTMGVTRNIMQTGLWPNQLLTQGVVTYLVNSGDHDIRKLDLRARSTLDTIALANGSNPTTISMYGEGKALITNNVTADLAFVDLASRTTEASLKLTKGAPFFEPAIVNGKAYVPADKWADDWSALEFSAIYVVDLATRTIVKTIELNADANPGNVSVDPAGKLWVGVKTGLVTIDPATDETIGSIEFGEKVGWVQYVSETKAYGSVSGGLVSFNPSTREILKSGADKIAVAEAGAFKIFQGAAYVTSFKNDTVTVVDLAIQAASGSPIPVGDGPQDLTFVTVED